MSCYPRTNSVDPADLFRTPRQRFANEHGLTNAGVREMCQLAARIATYGERECNGDQHPANRDRGDKAHNAELWGAERDLLIERLEELAAPIGTVALNGLRPSLRDAQGRYIEIPV